MAKLEVKLASIYAPKNQSEAVLKRLQEMAVIDIETTSLDEETFDLPEGFSRDKTDEESLKFTKKLSEAESVLKILDARAPVKKGMLSFLNGPRELLREEFYLSKEEQEKIVSVIKEITEAERSIAELNAERLRLTISAEQMKPWEELDIPLNFSGTAKTSAFIGTVTGAYTQDSLAEAIAKINSEITVCSKIVHSGKDLTYLFICCPKSQAEDAEAVLRELGFARPIQLTSKLPSVKLASKYERITKCAERIEENISVIQKLAKYREKIEIFADLCRANLEKSNTESIIAKTENTVMIKGYVAEKDVAFLTEELSREFTVVVETEDANEELAPVKLKNNAFASPAETITQMYSLPSASDIDPTPLTGFFYYFLFGMMLSDAGYGLLLILGTSLVLKKFSPSKSMKNMMKMFLYCGVSTFLWGLVFGSFFGDSIAVISRTFFGKEIALPALIDPMNGGAVTMLVLSLAIGLIQIIAGLGAKFVTCMKNGDKAGAFFDAGLWITTLLGAGILATGIFTVKILVTVGAVISILSLVGLILTQGRAHKNPILRLLIGVKSLYDITGYVSDLLSFSRLMALGLTTAAMGAVFNLLGTLLGGGITGALLMLVIFPLGHAISFALNVLGAYVHTLRLQYVELFSKFYDGGGREFKSFSIKNKYVGLKNGIKEEN